MTHKQMMMMTKVAAAIQVLSGDREREQLLSAMMTMMSLTLPLICSVDLSV
jgi:hypothetical protein